MAAKLPHSIFKCDEIPEEHHPKIDQTTQLAAQIFRGWQSRHAKRYQDRREQAQRFDIFAQNFRRIMAHNGNPEATYRMEVNEFSDLTWDEFKAVRLGGSGQNCSATLNKVKGAGGFTKPHHKEVPLSVDWRESGAVSEVKDQGSCGSCWTFSTTGCLEAHHFLKTGQSVLLSEQQLVDCADAFDNHGCNGGLPSHAFEYIASAGGLDTETAYPYLGKDAQCSFSKGGVGATVKGAVNITFQDEVELMEAVGTVGPVSIAFEVTSAFQHYSSGIFREEGCGTGPMDVNHAVLAVGYATDKESGQDYWVVKNSWGTDWGEEGYFKIARGENMCGLSDCASYPEL